MKAFYILFFTLFSVALFAQTNLQIFSENVGNPSDNTIPIPLYQGFQNHGSLVFFGSAEVQSNDPSTGYDQASGEGNVFFDNDGERFFRISNINTQNFRLLEISFGIFKSTDESDGSEMNFEYSVTGGGMGSFISLSFPALPTGPGTAGWYYVTRAIPPPLAHNLTNLVLQWRNSISGMDPPQFRIDDISLRGDYFFPEMFLSTDSIQLPPVAIGDSLETFYTVTADSLIQNVLIVSENLSFEIYDPINDLWTDSLILPKNGQVLDGEQVEVLVRHKPLNAIGDEVGVFRHSTFGGQDVMVEVFGTALATEPLEVTNTFTATATPEGTISLIWSGGNGDRRLILAKEGVGFPVNYFPTDGEFPLDATQDFNLAPAIDGNKFVYDGTALNTIIYGLNPATTYNFAIFEYNVGTGNSQNYLTSSYKETMATTVPGPPGLQVELTSNAYFINFQETVPNVLNGTYDGSGMSPAGLPGKLNTSAWRIRLNSSFVTPYSDNPQPNQNLSRLTDDGSTNMGGIYAFQTGGDNIALGVKPFPSFQNTNRVFSTEEGYFELKSQNKTSKTIEEIYVSFVYYVYNNGPASTTFRLSYSLNEFGPFTPLPAMEFETPAEDDLSPEWKKHVRSINISELNLPPNGFLYLRWSGEDTNNNPGNEERDAFAIDDITIAFNPDENFAGGTFSDTIQSGILAANAQLSDSSYVVESLTLQDSAILSTGVHALTLGPDVTINEDDGYIKGNLLISRVIEAGEPQTFGGIGLSITTPIEAGLTQVKRVTGQIVPSSNLPSILRYFEIEPEINTGMNATVAFTFEDFEVPFIPNMDNFRLFRRSIGSAGDWTQISGGLIDNTYTVTGINTFDIQLTAADPNAPLPLDWMSFEVSHERGYNLLKWVTANEVNTNVFEIQKSYNGKDFLTVSILPARGGYFSETYQFTDQHDRSGLIYYRIKQIDIDQKFSYSPLRSVRANSIQKLQIYPTLVLDQLMIFSDKEMEAQISVINAQGAIVKQFDLQLSAGDQPLSVNDLLGGVYWIRIENKEFSESFRIVKQ